MFVITCNNQNYDSCKEYPIGFKNTEEEANTFCSNAREQLLEYQKINGIIVNINNLTYPDKNFLDFFKNAHTSIITDHKDIKNYRFFIQGLSIKTIESFIRSFNINGVKPYNNYSVYSGDLAKFKGYDCYSDFYVYNIKELDNSI